MTESSNKINLKKNKQLFTQCDCGSEVLFIEYDFEIKMADLAIFQTDIASSSKRSLWQRLRYCWQILFHKKPYADQIMLDNQQLLKIKNFINELELI